MGHLRDLSFGAVTVVAVMFAWGCGNPFSRNLPFELTYGSAQGLRAGQLVYYHGVPVGEVTSIDVDSEATVSVEIGSDYAASIHDGLSFFIERDSADGSQLSLVAHDCGSPEARPVEAGARLAGSEGSLALAVCNARELLPDSVNNVLSTGAKMLGSAVEFGDALQGLSKEARGLNGKDVGRFLDERFPALEKQAEEYRRQLEAQGKKADAEKFWNGFLQWSEQAKRDSVGR